MAANVFRRGDVAAHGTRHEPGWLLVGHGTRDARGQREFLQTVHLVRRMVNPIRVEAGFLELAEPTIATAAARLAEVGIRRLVVSPVLLFAAGHARIDIPHALRLIHDNVGIPQIVQAGPLDCHPELLRLSADRFEAALREQRPFEPDQTLLIMVGRGSRDDGATERMHRFTELCAQTRQVARATTCFYAMARPSLDTALEEAAALALPLVIVQPHLLFHGDLLSALRERVRVQARKHTQIRWAVTPHLGPAPAVAQALVDRFADARLRLPGRKSPSASFK